MRIRNVKVFGPLVAAGLVFGGCNRSSLDADTRAADEAALREADIAAAKTGETKDLEKQMAVYVDERDGPMFLPQGAPLRSGRKEILEALRPAYDNPGFSVTWRPVQVEVARSGDLGFVRGVYETAMKGADGKISPDKGKYVEIWRKQRDGTWKLVMDIANSDLPTTADPLAPASKK